MRSWKNTCCYNPSHCSDTSFKAKFSSSDISFLFCSRSLLPPPGAARSRQTSVLSPGSAVIASSIARIVPISAGAIQPREPRNIFQGNKQEGSLAYPHPWPQAQSRIPQWTSSSSLFSKENIIIKEDPQTNLSPSSFFESPYSLTHTHQFTIPFFSRFPPPSAHCQ